MAKLKDVMRQLATLGTEQTRKTFARHGIEGDVFGVKVGDLKQVLKAIRGDQLLAEALYDTGNYDAMYLAGLVGDGAKMSQAVLCGWAEQAKWHAIAGTAVAWVATESDHAAALAASWIDDERDLLQSAGWVTLCGIVSTKDDAALDVAGLRRVLKSMKKRMSKAPDRVRYAMNNFVISVGCYVEVLSDVARETAAAIGVVDVDMGNTACKVPDAVAAIEKVESMGRIGLKRKTFRC